MGASRSKFTVCVVGLDGAGKTTFVTKQRGSGDKNAYHEDNKAFNLAVVQQVFGKTRFTLQFLDLAGDKNLRPLWKHFFHTAKPNTVLFVVDANDEARLPEARAEYQKILYDIDLIEADTIVVGNEKNQKGVLKESELRDKLDVPRQDEVIMVNACDPLDIKRCINHVCQHLSD